MCGIAGILSFSANRAELDQIHAVTDAMRRRGPDDQGVVFFDRSEPRFFACAGEDTPQEIFGLDIPHGPQSRTAMGPPAGSVLALGHRRLSVVDLSPAGHQPMCTEDGRYWITYNGEVYNHGEIRAQLQARGERFFSRTDTEVVLKAYRQWGAGCLSRFNGMWAFAIWDNVDKQLFCSRDRLGIRPFYYTFVGDCFVFASSIRALIASGLYEPEPDFEGIYQSMSFQCPLRPTTCFRGVHGLPQAHWMTIDLSGRPVTRPFWQIPLGEIEEQKTEKDWAQELQEALTHSIRRRLIADVPVGTYMSGGLDSTTISAVAAGQHPHIKAMTLAFRSGIPSYDKHDELPQARATAAMHPMQHIVKDVSAEDVVNALEDMAETFEEPFYPFTANYLVARLARQCEVRVALAGLGPDELFCGYNRHSWAQRWQQLPAWGRRLARYAPSSSRLARRLRRIGRIRSYGDAYVQAWSLFDDEQKQELFVSETMGRVSSHEALQARYDPPGYRFADAIEATCFYDVMSHVGNAHAFHEDQCGMRFSVESRFPYLDHEIVELSFRMPSRFKLHGNVGKYILRRVARKWIHPQSLSMPKRGFSLPVEWFLRGPLNEHVREKIRALKQRDFVRPAAIDQLQERAGSHDKSCVQLGFLLALESWLQKFIDGGAAKPRPPALRPLHIAAGTQSLKKVSA